MSSKDSKINNQTKQEIPAEQLAIQLLYCIDSSPIEERRKICQTIYSSLCKAITRVVSTVEEILKEKGLFKGSVSIIGKNLIDLIVQQKNMPIIKEFFLQFYEKGIQSFNLKRVIAFYNCLVENLHWTLKKGKILFIDLEKDDQPKGQEQTYIQIQMNFEEEKMQPNENSPSKNETTPAFVSNNQGKTQSNEVDYEAEVVTKEIQVIEENCVEKVEMSEASKSFIRIFTEGFPAKCKGKTVRKYRIDCLQPGEPGEYYVYYDEMVGGNTKVIFTSPK